MLILQRRKGQSLSINNNIKLTIVDTGADWVKLAIDAPKEIPILRTELVEAAAENQEASRTVSREVLDKILKQRSNSGLPCPGEAPRLFSLYSPGVLQVGLPHAALRPRKCRPGRLHFLREALLLHMLPRFLW